MYQPNYHLLLQTILNKSLETTANTQEYLESSNTIENIDIAKFLEENLLWQETIPEQKAQRYKLPKTLPAILQKALKANGISSLYSHQARCLKAIRKGKDVVITTDTASGKTLGAYIPILENLLQNDGTALAFYGLKALSSDQNQKLTQLIDAIPQSTRPFVALLNGDTSKPERESLLARSPQIISSTPELIHYALRSIHFNAHWQQFFSRLKFIVIDEAHTFNGVYGANMTNLLRRIKLTADRYGGNSNKFQFVFLSATVGNPKELARKLSDRPKKKTNQPDRLYWIDKSGARKPEQQLIVTRPSSNPNIDTARIILFLLQKDLAGICFVNSRQSIKSLFSVLIAEAQGQKYYGIEQQIAIFYSSLTQQRRGQILAGLEQGQIRCVIATSALEAGIDIGNLDFAIVRGWPNSLQAFRQRIGRAGRNKKGLAIFLPNQYSPLDRYYAEQPRALLSAKVERVSFNANYPIDLGKHLMCAAVENGFSLQQAQQYFSSQSIPLLQALMTQGVLRKSRERLWAKGFPHRDVNFRGSTNSHKVSLIDIEQSEIVEELDWITAQREVFTGAIYRRQHPTDGMIVYRCEELTSDKAVLRRVSDTGLYTRTTTEIEIEITQVLSQPYELTCSSNSSPTPLAKLTLASISISEATIGYQLLQKKYELSCLNTKCLKYKEPLHNLNLCPICHKKTKRAELSWLIDEPNFTEPLTHQLNTICTKIELNNHFYQHLQPAINNIKQELKQHSPDFVWQYPIEFMVLHSFGHLVLSALPLLRIGASSDVNFLIDSSQAKTFTGYFYDANEGGNGASETIWRFLDPLANKGAALALQCNCTNGCPRCLHHTNCPERNQGLLKQLGIAACKLITAENITKGHVGKTQ